MTRLERLSLTDQSVPLKGVRIARVSTVPFFVVAQLKKQFESLADMGAIVVSVTSDGPELSMLSGIDGVECEVIDIPRSITPWRDIIALAKLFLFFRKQQFHIVHSTTPKAGLLSMLAAFMAGVPVRLHTFTGQPWVNMRGIKRWLTRNSDRVIASLSTHCYADSASQRAYLVEQNIVVEDHISVIGAGSLAGVDLGRFDKTRFEYSECTRLRSAIGIPEEAKVLLFIGRITADKGINELLQAFASLKRTGCTAHLIFVGSFDTESGVSGSITRGQVELIPDTHIVGYSNVPEHYLAIADILCLPSYREGFGTVVIEAAAMGVPTVGTNIYGLSDAIIHGETGLLVAPRDAESLAKAIAELLGNERLLSKMGSSSKQRARELFDAGFVNGQVAKVYVELLRVVGAVM